MEKNTFVETDFINSIASEDDESLIRNCNFNESEEEKRREQKRQKLNDGTSRSTCSDFVCDEAIECEIGGNEEMDFDDCNTYSDEPDDRRSSKRKRYQDKYIMKKFLASSEIVEIKKRKSIPSCGKQLPTPKKRARSPLSLAKQERKIAGDNSAAAAYWQCNIQNTHSTQTDHDPFFIAITSTEVETILNPCCEFCSTGEVILKEMEEYHYAESDYSNTVSEQKEMIQPIRSPLMATERSLSPCRQEKQVTFASSVFNPNLRVSTPCNHQYVNDSSNNLAHSCNQTLLNAKSTNISPCTFATQESIQSPEYITSPDSMSNSASTACNHSEHASEFATLSGGGNDQEKVCQSSSSAPFNVVSSINALTSTLRDQNKQCTQCINKSGSENITKCISEENHQDITNRCSQHSQHTEVSKNCNNNRQSIANTCHILPIVPCSDCDENGISCPNIAGINRNISPSVICNQCKQGNCGACEMNVPKPCCRSLQTPCTYCIHKLEVNRREAGVQTACSNQCGTQTKHVNIEHKGCQQYLRQPIRKQIKQGEAINRALQRQIPLQYKNEPCQPLPPEIPFCNTPPPCPSPKNIINPPVCQFYTASESKAQEDILQPKKCQKCNRIKQTPVCQMFSGESQSEDSCIPPSLWKMMGNQTCCLFLDQPQSSCQVLISTVKKLFMFYLSIMIFLTAIALLLWFYGWLFMDLLYCNGLPFLLFLILLLVVLWFSNPEALEKSHCNLFKSHHKPSRFSETCNTRDSNQMNLKMPNSHWCISRFC